MWRTAASLALLLLLLFVLLGTSGKLTWWMWTEKSPRLMLCFCPPSGITEEATLFAKVHLTWMIPIIVILIIHSAPSKAAWRPPPPPAIITFAVLITYNITVTLVYFCDSCLKPPSRQCSGFFKTYFSVKKKKHLTPSTSESALTEWGAYFLFMRFLFKSCVDPYDVTTYCWSAVGLNWPHSMFYSRALGCEKNWKSALICRIPVSHSNIWPSSSKKKKKKKFKHYCTAAPI